MHYLLYFKGIENIRVFPGVVIVCSKFECQEYELNYCEVCCNDKITALSRETKIAKVSLHVTGIAS